MLVIELFFIFDTRFRSYIAGAPCTHNFCFIIVPHSRCSIYEQWTASFYRTEEAFENCCQLISRTRLRLWWWSRLTYKVNFLSMLPWCKAERSFGVVARALQYIPQLSFVSLKVFVCASNKCAIRKRFQRCWEHCYI